jgi:hypothetical protein
MLHTPDVQINPLGAQSCIALTMERLFSPCTRYRDQLETQAAGYDEPLQELNLDVSTDELLGAERAFTYADLYAMLEIGNVVLWLTPHAAVAHIHGQVMDSWFFLYESCTFDFNADGQKMIAFARSPQQLTEICDVVLRLLATSVVHSVCLQELRCPSEPINAPTLAYLMEHCHSLKLLVYRGLEMDENHCRVLGTYSRPDLEINLDRCTFTSAGTSALVEVLGRNQGPTELNHCDMDYSMLANGLRGNSRLKRLTLHISDQELLAIAGALNENEGLVDLDLGCRLFGDEAWGAVCDSFKTHPTLEVLQLWSAGDASVAPAVLKSRIQVLLDMLKVNTSIHTIHFVNSRYSEHELFQGSVIPYLETNRLRPYVRAIQKTRPIAYRAKVLGRALLAVRTDPNRFWMLLSGNAEVVFASTTATTATTIAAGTNLSTPPTAALTVTVTDTDSTTRADFIVGTLDTEYRCCACLRSEAQATSLVPPGIF